MKKKVPTLFPTKVRKARNLMDKKITKENPLFFAFLAFPMFTLNIFWISLPFCANQVVGKIQVRSQFIFFKKKTPHYLTSLATE